MYDRLAIARIKANDLDNVPETVSPESISRRQHDLIPCTDFDVPLGKQRQIIRLHGNVKCEYRLFDMLGFLGSI